MAKLNALKKFMDRVTHEVPTGPHTDVKRRKINPSFKKRKVQVDAFKKRRMQTPSAGRAKHNIGGRANLLEEMGRIDARKHPDAADRAEKRRVIGELNKGYKSGGRSGYNSGGAVLKGKKVGCQIK